MAQNDIRNTMVAELRRKFPISAAEASQTIDADPGLHASLEGMQARAGSFMQRLFRVEYELDALNSGKEGFASCASQAGVNVLATCFPTITRGQDNVISDEEIRAMLESEVARLQSHGAR